MELAQVWDLKQLASFKTRDLARGPGLTYTDTNTLIHESAEFILHFQGLSRL